MKQTNKQTKNKHYNDDGDEMRIETQLEFDKFNARPNRHLKDHLSNVSLQTLSFLPPRFSEIAYRAGLWHDIGKYRLEWQKYLKANIDGTWDGKKLPHAIHGAILACRLKLPSIAFVIAGHHSGLHDADKLGEKVRNSESITETEEAIANALTELDLKLGLEQEKEQPRDFDIRMLFSALVDADRLDAGNEPPKQWTIEGLNIDAIPPDDNPINQLRSQFFQQCQSAATGERGIYRITGPCGIGKTRAMMQFGLKHAQHNFMRGVVYLSPFCSILDQSYNTYKDLLGEDNLIPCWSTFNLDGNDDKEERLKHYQSLAERWDAPIILSTSVAFFDSILSNKPSKLRKLHQLQSRCVILDEVQSLPKALLKTILDVLRELTENWGCTIVLSSATNPAFEQLGEDFKLPVTDVIKKDKVKELFVKLNRCNFIQWKEPTTFEAIADDIEQTTGSGLVVVNTRKLARDGFKVFRDRFEKSWHLSTYMCPVHREKIIREAKQHLSNGEGVLISTSLIEAGVDIDCVRGYRQFVGLDSIYQTSGRINRNGLRKDADLVVFDIKSFKARNDVDMQAKIDIARRLLGKGNRIDDPNLFVRFFQDFYAGERDPNGIEELRGNLKFQEVANKFKMIDSITESVIINYDDKSKELINKIKHKPDLLNKADLRQLNRYSIALRPDELDPENPRSFAKEVEEVNGFELWLGGYDECGIFDNSKAFNRPKTRL